MEMEMFDASNSPSEAMDEDSMWEDNSEEETEKREPSRETHLVGWHEDRVQLEGLRLQGGAKRNRGQLMEHSWRRHVSGRKKLAKPVTR